MGASKPTYSIIVTKDLSIGYRSKKQANILAKNIAIDIPTGSLTAVIGINGIGKTSLLKTLSKRLQPLAGTIEIDGATLHKIPSSKLAKTMSLVLTESLAVKTFTVEELVALGRSPYTNWIGRLSKQDHQIVAHALRQTHISHLKHYRCDTLSDGQLQRVMIARALAQDTPLILMDEPTTHLDLYRKIEVMTLLKELCAKQNKTIVFASHELELAIQLCDRMVLMTPDVVHFGSPRELIANNKIGEIFPKDLIDFDAEAGRFVLRK
ncbi:MAG: ABC transporter ATP-binding protein [Flavobacteriaceae bacterium]|nr:ABC transporter ATP-binding protein [Flavobacteriaceae bacterium]